MIRINLLGQQERPRAKRRAAAVTTESGQKIAVACSLVLVLAALGVGWWYWSLYQEGTRLAQEIADAQQETARLRSLIVQVQQFEARKAQLQQRVSLIEQLRRGQSGPVHMLDELSRALPEMLWLVQLEQKGTELTIDGQCTTYTALSDFVDNLGGSGWFTRPVEIMDSQVEGATAASAELIRFTVKAQFAPPGG
ncbi:MAG: PilN domain-containing protein [Acidobacteriota bacterium]